MPQQATSFWSQMLDSGQSPYCNIYVMFHYNNMKKAKHEEIFNQKGKKHHIQHCMSLNVCQNIPESGCSIKVNASCHIPRDKPSKSKKPQGWNEQY